MSSTSGVMENLNKKCKSIKKALSFMRRSTKLNSQEVQEYLKWLNEKNSALTQQLSQTQLELEKAKQENTTLRSDYETKESLFEEDKRFLVEEIKSLKSKINEKYVDMEKVTAEISTLKRESEAKNLLLKEELEFKEALREKVCKLKEEVRTLKKDMEDVKKGTSQDQSSEALSNVLIKEVDSLRDVVDTKNNEIQSMQMALTEAKQKEIALKFSTQKLRRLKTKCEDMEAQLKRKTESERDLEAEIYKLRRNILEENSQNRRLSYENEELHWKLKQKRNVGCNSVRSSNFAPPIPPKVRKIVKKHTSEGYELDMEESSKQDGQTENISCDAKIPIA